MNKLIFNTILILTLTISAAAASETNNINQQELIKSNQNLFEEKQFTVTAKFVNIEHIFENEYYLIFKMQKGPAVKLYVSFPDEKMEEFNFLVEKGDRIAANRKMKNKNFIIKYTQKHEEDENTGAPRTRNYIDSIELKK